MQRIDDEFNNKMVGRLFSCNRCGTERMQYSSIINYVNIQFTICQKCTFETVPLCAESSEKMVVKKIIPDTNMECDKCGDRTPQQTRILAQHMHDGEMETHAYCVQCTYTYELDSCSSCTQCIDMKAVILKLRD